MNAGDKTIQAVTYFYQMLDFKKQLPEIPRLI